MIGYTVAPERWITVPRFSHPGADAASAFSKNDDAPTPSGQRSRVAGRPATCGSITAAISV